MDPYSRRSDPSSGLLSFGATRNSSVGDLLIERAALSRTIDNTSSVRSRLQLGPSNLSLNGESEIDWSKFDYKSDPYYIEKREQLKLKTSNSAAADDIVNEKLSYEQKLRAVADQLRELDQESIMVDSLLPNRNLPTPRFTSSLSYSTPTTSNFNLSLPPPPPLLQPKVSPKASKRTVRKAAKTATAVPLIAPNPVSNVEDPYDKYNKNPIGNIVGKRAQRIKEQLARKKADAEKQDDDIIAMENSAESAVPDSSTEVSQSTSENVECEEVPIKRARSSSVSEVTTLHVQPDSSTDNICVSSSLSSSADSDIVDSTTPAIQYLTQQQENENNQTSSTEVDSSSNSVGSKERPIEIGNEEPESVADDSQCSSNAQDDSNDDDGMLAMFLREQRESVKSEASSLPKSTTPPVQVNKVPFSLKRIPPKTTVRTSPLAPLAKNKPLLSSLQKFKLSETASPIPTVKPFVSISSQLSPVTQDHPTSSRFTLDSCGSTSTTQQNSLLPSTSVSNSESSTSWLAIGRELDDVIASRSNRRVVDEDSLNVRLRREEMQAEEEMRRRESSSTAAGVSHSGAISTADPLSVLDTMWRGLTSRPVAPLVPTRNELNLDPYATVRTSEQRRIAIERELERKRLIKEEQKAMKEAMELEKRRVIERRLHQEIADLRERERKRLLAEQQKLLELKRQEEEDIRCKLEEERKERERIERERKLREKREKERRLNEDVKLRTTMIKVFNFDMNEEFTGSMEKEVKESKDEKFSGNKLSHYKCFENFEAFDIGGVGKSVTMTQYHIFSEDINDEPLAGEFDDEITIRDVETALQVAKENICRKRMEKFAEVLKKVPDNYLSNPDETVESLEEDFKCFTQDKTDEEQDLSDSELAEIVDSIKMECQEMKERMKRDKEEAEKRKALLAAKMAEREKQRLELKALAKSSASSSSSTRREVKSSKADSRHREKESSQRNEEELPVTSSISTVMRRNPDDPGRINYEPEKRKSSNQIATSNSDHINQGSSNTGRTSKLLSDFIKETGFTSGSNYRVKQEHRSPPPMGIPIPPPNMFPPMIPPPPDPNAMYGAAAASFAALNFQRFSFNDSSSPFADTINKIGGVTVVPRPSNEMEPLRNRRRSVSRSPPRKHKMVAQKRRGRSRSRSLSSSDFRPPQDLEPPPKPAAHKKVPTSRHHHHHKSHVGDRVPHKRSPKQAHSHSSSHHSQKHRKEKSKKHHKERHKKAKRKSKKDSSSKSKRHSSKSKLKKRVKKEPLDPGEGSSGKIFVNPHHENFKRFYTAKEESAKISEVRAISVSSSSSSDSYSDD